MWREIVSITVTILLTPVMLLVWVWMKIEEMKDETK
jgi:hypothetical protein